MVPLGRLGRPGLLQAGEVPAHFHCMCLDILLQGIFASSGGDAAAPNPKKPFALPPNSLYYTLP